MPEADRGNLTRAQFLIWTGQTLYPHSPLYNMVLAFTIHGRIDPAAFETAFATLVAKSDSMRTVFETIDGQPRRRVLSTLPYRLEQLDMSGPADDEAGIRAWLRERAKLSFDLSQRLFDTVLVKLAGDRWIWYLNKHHLITDGWSTAVTYQRMQELYRLAVEDRLAEAAEFPTFEAYVDYERSRRTSRSYKKAQEYWKRKLASAPEPLEFYGRKARLSGTTRTERVTFELGRSRSDALRRLAGEADLRAMSLDLSLFNIFTTVLFAYLGRVSGRRQLGLLAPAHNRPSQAFKNTIGLFLEVLPLHVTVDEGDTLQELHRKVAAESKAFLLNAQPATSTSSVNRSYAVLLNFINASFSGFDGLPMTSEWVHSGHGDTSHSLRLQVHDFDGAGSFRLHFDLSHDLFDEERRQWVVRHFVRMLDGFIEDRTQHIENIDLLSDEERLEHLVRFNKPSGACPRGTVVREFEAQVRCSPDAVALVDGAREITYRELDERANRLAHRLQRSGVRPDTRVGIFLDRSAELVIAVLGTLKSGGAYLPIDTRYPAPRTTFMLEDSRASVVLTRDSLRDRLPATDAEIIAVDADPIVSDSAACSACPATEQHLAYVIYTSGSTGRPKGVEVAHRALLNYAAWARDYYLCGERLDFALYSSFSFDLTVTSLFVPLISGSRIVIYGEAAGRDLAILRVFEDDRVDVVKLTPSHLALVLAASVRGSRIKKLIVGGEELKTDLARRVYEAFEGRVAIFNEYGPTEATVGCMVHEYQPEADTLAAVPIGRPAANARIYVLARSLAPVPLGVVGELCIAGDGVARGYLGRPELTGERFVAEPERPGGRMYRSGDLARWRAPGALEFLGRADDQVKIRGARIEPAEVETALRAHPDVKECTVAVVETRIERAAATSARHCVRCGLESNHPEARLDARDVCQVCIAYDSYRDAARQYFRTMDDLRQLFADRPRRSDDGYDCMMLLSGGKDSTYALYQLVDMGLRVLAFSLDNGYISDGAKANIRRAVDELGVELVFGTTPAMNAIFADSLKRFSNVCNGCFKTIYTLAMNLARERGIRHIVTGLSRGQIFETRIADFFRIGIFDPDEIDRSIVEARKAYHRMNDVVASHLDVEMFADDHAFDELRIIDFYRYCDVSLSDLLSFLAERAPWIRPADTGRSTNCLINDVGIFVHKRERGYHNYALPYSWDVRLGHKVREAALAELDDEIDVGRSLDVLRDVGYVGRWEKQGQGENIEKRLASYYVSDAGELSSSQLRKHLGQRLPDYMIPSYFVRVDDIPLTVHGKVARDQLPDPRETFSATQDEFETPRGATEQHLASIWREVLGAESIGRQDNFFDLGGDSILNIQIVARARAAGLRVTSSQIFEHPTVAELAAVAQQVTPTRQSQPVSGAVSLTPIQHWFFELDLAVPGHWSHVVELRTSGAVDRRRLGQAVEHLARHHDVLRGRVAVGASGSELQLDEQIRVAAGVRAGAFDLERGPLLRFGVLAGGALGDKVRIEIHHLLVDAVSWSILLEDLETVYGQLERGEEVRLPAKTTSFQEWSARLQQLARSDVVRAESDYWLEAGAAVGALPLDDADGPGAAGCVMVGLDRGETTRLLREVPPVYNTGVEDLLLTALLDAFREQGGQSALRLHLERHGREELGPGVDVSRTVGWFTALFPLTLSWPEAGGPVAALKSVKERLRAVPRQGIGYGLLRYLGDADIAERLRAVPAPDLLFNYLGRLDALDAASSRFRLAGPLALSRDPSEPSPHRLEINAYIQDGQLQVAWTFRAGTRRGTVEAIAQRFERSLRWLIEEIASGEAGGYTPSDFPQAELSQQQLDEIIDEFAD